MVESEKTLAEYALEGKGVRLETASPKNEKHEEARQTVMLVSAGIIILIFAGLFGEYVFITKEYSRSFHESAMPAYNAAKKYAEKAEQTINKSGSDLLIANLTNEAKLELLKNSEEYFKKEEKIYSEINGINPFIKEKTSEQIGNELSFYEIISTFSDSLKDANAIKNANMAGSPEDFEDFKKIIDEAANDGNIVFNAAESTVCKNDKAAEKFLISENTVFIKVYKNRFLTVPNGLAGIFNIAQGLNFFNDAKIIEKQCSEMLGKYYAEVNNYYFKNKDSEIFYKKLYAASLKNALKNRSN